MRIFRLNPAASARKYCFVEGAFPYDESLQRGQPVLAEMKADGVDALEYHLDEVTGGLEIGDYFTTTTNHLPVTRTFADAVAAKFNLGAYEFVPARVRNSKRRVHVKDVVIINPLEPVDCLDWNRSQLNNSKTYPLVRILGKWNLLADRVPADRDLFRVRGLIGYLFSERLVTFIADQKLKNFEFEGAPLT